MADALASGASVRKDVGVQVPPRAHDTIPVRFLAGISCVRDLPPEPRPWDGGGVTTPGRNWAETHTYAAAALHRPSSVDELRTVVADSLRVRALGSRHSFHDLADTSGLLVSLDAIPREVVVDADAGTATVGAAASYAEIAPVLHRAGWGLGAMASLPHISVAGAVATATHGSGDAAATLAGAVTALETVGPDGDLAWTTEADPDLRVLAGLIFLVEHDLGLLGGTE